MAATVAVLAGCATNPVTGRRELALVSEAQEIEMGRQSFESAQQSLGLVQDQALQDYVHRVGTALAATSERPNLPWTFRVFDDPTPNAFAAPGGYIGVTRGLLELMDSEAELAAVIGHEIGHVTARHSVQQISRQQLAQIGLGIGMILSPTVAQLGDLASTGLQLLFLKYGRDAERQSDELGFKYAQAGRYDMREMDDVFAALQRAGEREGGGRVPSWLSTHPDPGERVQTAQERAAQLGPAAASGRAGREEFLARIDGMVQGVNPRNGFFREGVFYHPDLRFRLSFPSGWQTQNLSQAVIAGSPQQDAMLQLTLAGQAGASAAARQFLSQQGVQPIQSRQQTVNGVPGVISYFQAQTQQGVLQGMAAHLEYGGNTYQLLAFAPAQRFGNYERLFSQVVGSFAPLTDPAILGVQPNRIDIVRLEQAMTLAEFARRYPSVVELEQLALLNQVTDANTRLPAGTQLKRVVRG